MFSRQLPKKINWHSECNGCKHAKKTTSGKVWCWKFAVKLGRIKDYWRRPIGIFRYRDCEGIEK